MFGLVGVWLIMICRLSNWGTTALECSHDEDKNVDWEGGNEGARLERCLGSECSNGVWESKGDIETPTITQNLQTFAEYLLQSSIHYFYCQPERQGFTCSDNPVWITTFTMNRNSGEDLFYSRREKQAPLVLWLRKNSPLALYLS